MLPRALHPVAWWAWALGLAAAASRTTNPLLLLLILVVLGVVVSARRTQAPWARGFHYYLLTALVVIAIRVVFRTLFSADDVAGEHVLFTLPRLAAPRWYAGVQLGGPVTAEATLTSAVDGLRLGTLLCCIGAANMLANPKRALRVLPGALYELGVAVVVALSLAPQLVESVQRVRRARRLRAGAQRGFRALASIAIPVLEDALERSLLLAAAMDSRGYGRTTTAGKNSRRVTAGLLLGGLAALCAGAYGLLDATTPAYLGPPALAAGTVLCVAGLALGSRRVQRSAYRPDPWGAAEWMVVASAAVAVVVLYALAPPASLNPSFEPLRWPSLSLGATIAILAAALPAFATPAHAPTSARSAEPNRELAGASA